MSARILCLNAGSSSLKGALFDGDAPLLRVHVSGLPEAPQLAWILGDGDARTQALDGPLDAEAAARTLFDCVEDDGRLESVAAVAHRGADRRTAIRGVPKHSQRPVPGLCSRCIGAATSAARSMCNRRASSRWMPSADAARAPGPSARHAVSRPMHRSADPGGDRATSGARPPVIAAVADERARANALCTR